MNQAKRLTIKTKKQVLSEIVGNNASRFTGEGYDFHEIRAYEVGEDIRKIDWVITAKLQKPFVKLFLEERQLNIATVTLLDQGMRFGTKQTKQELAAEITGLLGFASVYNGDAYLHRIYAPTCVHAKSPTKNFKYIQEAIAQTLDALPSQDPIDLSSVCAHLSGHLTKKSVLFVIGDFIDANLTLHTLAKKHEVIALIVRDKVEENPQILHTNTTLIDPHTFDQGSVAQLQKHQDFIYNNDQNLYRYLRRHGIKFEKFYTGQDPIKKLKKLFR